MNRRIFLQSLTTAALLPIKTGTATVKSSCTATVRFRNNLTKKWGKPVLFFRLPNGKLFTDELCISKDDSLVADRVAVDGKEHGEGEFCRQLSMNESSETWNCVLTLGEK